MSPPARVAWIETMTAFVAAVASSGSPPARVAWIETPGLKFLRECQVSPPARVAWIETGFRRPAAKAGRVATREGGVDRNVCSSIRAPGRSASPPARVAWIETAILPHPADVYEGRHPRGWRG